MYRPTFGFSRYAEKLGRSANHFDELYQALQQPLSYIDQLMMGTAFAAYIAHTQPLLVAISAPFPGNLFSAFSLCPMDKTKPSPLSNCVWAVAFPIPNYER
jgi:hypothetical protein